MPSVDFRRPRPRWRRLTSELADATSPASELLTDALPSLRQIQADYRDVPGPIRISGGSSNAGTLGSAFDLWVQLHALPRPQLEPVSRGARLVGPAMADACDELLNFLGPAGSAPVRSFIGTWTGPTTRLESDALLRLCWAAACLVEVFRIGRVAPGSPIAALPPDGVPDLLGLAPAAVVDELADLTALASTRLLPRLCTMATNGPTWPNPTLAGSAQMPADADLVVGHTLVELKTVLGSKTATGRRAVLDKATLYQLVGYVVHDYGDELEISSVALYQARYGHLAVWDLQRLLDQLAGRPVDLPQLRERWRAMLAAGKTIHP